jgi:N-carbamoylputrescine amidase
MASNRIGVERSPLEPERVEIRFYGNSFIADAEGALIAVASEDREEIITADFDLDAARTKRDAWFVFRDRRPELYGVLSTHDGRLLPTA